MHVLDFNEELHNKSLKEEGFDEGMAKGLSEAKAESEAEGQRISILEFLEALGTVDQSIKDHLSQITDSTELSRLHKAAAKADIIEEFEKDYYGITQ